MIARIRKVHRDLREVNAPWTFHLFMSIVTADATGQFNRFGLVYWPLRDRAKTWRANR